jgi:hypothetical protein
MMFEDDLVVKCYEIAKLTLFTLHSQAEREFNEAPKWNLKRRYMLRGAKAAFLLLIENLNKLESEYKIKKMKDKPYDK